MIVVATVKLRMENLNELNKAYSNEFNKSSFILGTNDFNMNSITTNFASERQTFNRFKQHFPISCFTNNNNNNGSSNTNKYGNKLANNKLSNSIHNTTPHSSSSLSPSSSSSSSFCFPSTNESSLKYGRSNGDAIKKQEKNQFIGQKSCKQLKSELFIEKNDKPVVQHLNQSSSITSLSSSYSSSTSDSSISLPKPTEPVVQLRSKPINCKINIKPICYSDFQHSDKRVPINPSRKSLIFNLSSSSSPDPTSESFTSSSSSDFQRLTSKPLTTIRNSMFVNGNNMNYTKNKVLLETVSERFSAEMNKRNNNNNVIQLETKSTTLVDNDDLNLFKNDHSTQFHSENKKKSIVRSNSCLNSGVKTFDVSNRRELLNQRRQRHLTTTALLCDQASNHTNFTKNSLNSQVSFENFLQSLEDINTLLENNTYLERKKITDTFKPKQIQPLIDQRQQNKRNKRNLTQPIVFTNELSRLCSTEKAPEKIGANSIQIKYEPKFTETSNKNFNVYKMSNENGKNVPVKKSSVVPKKFVSLSDILSNGNNTSNKSFYVPSPLTTVKENIVSTPIRSEEKPEPFPVRPAKPTQSIAYSNSFNDLLTVQALFKELELDCDEQIKILDDKERSQKEISHKQKEILDEIKQKWLFRTSNDVPNKLNDISSSSSSSKLKCNCNSKKSKLESRNSKNKLRFFSRTNLRKHYKKGAFHLVCLLFQDEEPIINKSRNNNRAIKTQRAIFKFKTNFNASFKTRIKFTNTKSVFLFKKQHKKSNNKTKIYFTCLNNNRNFLPDIENFQLKTYRQILREQCSKNKKKSNQTKSGSNRHLMQQQSLLDKYYEKYCNSNGADMSTIKKPYCLLNQLNLPNTSIENYPFPTVASDSSSAHMLSDKEKDTHDKRRALFISETNEMKNIEFANLIDACKWLIEAGYGKFVYSFLKANNKNNKPHSNEENRLHTLNKTSLNMPIRQEDTNNLDRPQLDSAIEMIRSSQYDLQDCDLNAIYRRLETLFNSASVLNLDYNYLKENYLNNIEDDEFDDEDYDDDEINYDDQLTNIDPVEDLVGLHKTRKHLPLPPLFLDEEENSSSSANLSSEEPSPTSESNKHTNMTSVQLNRNTMSNNKFVCIDFPLNANANSIKNKNRQSLIESASSQHNELHLRNEASTSLNRFHSFRLNEKLPNIEESNLIINSNLSKSYLDLSKSNENNSSNIRTIDPILNMLPSPVQVDSKKSNSIDEQSEINLKNNLAKPTRTATVVISLRQRKDINTIKTKKNPKTDKLLISNDEIDDKVEENLKTHKDIKKFGLCNKLPIVELSRMNFCENVLTSSSESSDLSAQSYTNLNTKLIDCANDPGSTSTISSSTSCGKKPTYSNLISNASLRTSSEKKIAALAANPNLFTASSSVSGIFNNNLNTKIKSLESSIQVLSQAKQFVKSQPKTSLNDINNNVVKMKNENVNKEILKRVDANYLNLDSLSTIDITLNKKQAANTILLLNNSDESIILESTAIAAGTPTANKSITEESNQNNSKRERCDSGVGGSLTRDISKKRNREKWASFIKSHRPSFKSPSQLQINSLSVKQYCKLKKFALVRITALMEKYSQVCQKSGWTRFKTVPKFIKRHQKSMDNTLYKNKHVFGVPLKLNFQRHGQPLPQPIIQVMKYLRRNASNTVGIFRKSGSKLRMAMLREIIERFSSESFADFEKQINNVYGNNLNNNNGDLNSIGSGFSSQSTSKSDLIDEVNTTDKCMIGSDTIAIDMADILKQYFRELPECLFTNKMSQTLIDIFTYLPEEERLEALQYCMLLLDDENRDVLQCLLYFLHDIAQNHQIHKMDARNIAICLAPTLLNMSNLKETPSANSHISPSGSPTGPPPSMYKDPTQIMTRQCNASLECLTFMIEMPKKIFQIPNEAYTKCQFTKTDYSVSLTLNEVLGSYSQSMLNMYLNDRIDEMIKEIKDKPRNWNRFPNDSNIETYFKLIEDEHFPLRLWKLTIELEASPTDVLNKLLRHRAEWDDDMGESRIVETLSSQADIFQYSMNMMAPQPSRDFCELRSWCDMSHVNIKYQFVIYSASIEHDNALKLGDIRANTVKNFYLIETTSNEKKCKLHQIYRADYRGYSSEWYHKTQAYLLKRNLINLKDCLKYK